MGLFNRSEETPDKEVLLLKEENAYLRRQVEKLQDALVAKESPVAYQYMKSDEMDLRDNDLRSDEEREKDRIRNRLMAERLRHIEEPLWNDGDEMINLIDKLNAGIGLRSKPLHDDQES